MLLPQVRVGIAERRRPDDLVVFVPIQYLMYKRYAIELDGGHSHQHTERDASRDRDLASENYEVISLRPQALGYFREVQKLIERIAVEMTEAERNPSEFATAVENASYYMPSPPITDDDIPF